jgi:hypothetical protein
MTSSAPGSTAASVETARYELCGTELEVGTTDDVVADLIGARLRFHRSSSDAAPDVVFDIRRSEGEGGCNPLPGPSRPVYDAPGGRVAYFTESDELFIEHPGALRALCHPASGHVRVRILKEEPGRFLAARPFFTIPLLETMKRRSRYSLHAALLAVDGRGVLLAGASGSGKSTLTVGLVRAGWHFLSDDMVFLQRGVGGLWAWGLSEGIDVSEHTAGMLPELRHVLDHPLPAGRHKWTVDVEETFGVVPVPASRPSILVVLAISGERRSVLTPISGPVALRQLAPNVLLTRSDATQAHLDILAELVNQVPCYSLVAGYDLDDAVRCLWEVLDCPP